MSGSKPKKFPVPIDGSSILPPLKPKLSKTPYYEIQLGADEMLIITGNKESIDEGLEAMEEAKIFSIDPNTKK